MTRAREPQTSICIPVFNGAAWIERAVRSALEQTRPILEVVVVDNASTDATVERVREIGDSRVRLFANSRNLGVFRNFNRALSLARGRYLKFLCADDALHPDCIEAMEAVFESDPQVGLVFSPRAIELADPTNPTDRNWKARHERSHAHFGELRMTNSGAAMLDTWIGDQLASNWIGEPTNVMMSRDCLRRVGTFSLHMNDRGDMDLWIRAMLFYDVGFVDRPLSSFLVRSGSLGSSNRRTGQAWLDRLWLLEGLLAYEEARRRYPTIRWLRSKGVIRTARNALRGTRTPEAGKLSAIRPYVAYRFSRRRDRSTLHGTIDDLGEPGETIEVGRRQGLGHDFAPML